VKGEPADAALPGLGGFMRAHPIGQSRPVTIYRLVTAERIEEKIVQLHHAKRDLADSLLEGTDTAHTLTADELIDLLRDR
jgi:SNF2 family DNA or RNA helicase